MIARVVLVLLGIALVVNADGKGYVADPNELKLIGCDVCKRAISELYQALQSQKLNGKKITEELVEEVYDTICAPPPPPRTPQPPKGPAPPSDAPAPSLWTRKLDITEVKSRGGERSIALTEPGGVSKCGSECSAIRRSCTNLLTEDVDPDDLLMVLWKNKTTVADMQKRFCTANKKRCPKKFPALSASRVDETFSALSSKELEMETLMESMEAAGMGGMKMFSRDDYIQKMADSYGDDLDELADAYGGGQDEL